jgi:3-hydroxyisobutyrate dehydrogenase
MAHIGFVGLGHMGLPMAINLVRAGHVVTGFDQQPQAMDAFVVEGGIRARTLQEAAIGKTVVITMLQTGSQVHTVCFGEQGLFQSMAKDALFMNCSTIGVEAMRRLHQVAEASSIRCLDAPVSGGVAGAMAGTLTMMVGGLEATFEHAKPILSCLGSMLIYTGEAGSGQAAKLCNNMILGVSMIAVSEAFLLAERLGLSPQKLHEVVSQSSGQCWSISRHVPLPGILPHVPANQSYQPGFSTNMMLKDLLLSQEAAASVGLDTVLGALATKVYQGVNDEIGALDFSAIVTCLATAEKNDT